MIKEAHVSFEVAQLLKEKGFNERSFGSYNGKGEFQEGWGKWNTTPIYYAAPTQQMVMKWLREVHDIHTEICLYKTCENDVEPKKSRKAPYYTFGVWNSVTGDNVDKRLTNDFIGDTYEEAVEEAIKYCLENLVKDN